MTSQSTKINSIFDSLLCPDRPAYVTIPYHDYRNDSTASRMRSLYALHLSLSVAIPAIQPHLRLSGTNRLRSAFHGGQRRIGYTVLRLPCWIKICVLTGPRGLSDVARESTKKSPISLRGETDGTGSSRMGLPGSLGRKGRESDP
ncbi:MAG: hypothetical protein KZQ63_19120 [Candidatus Thiodiazotropha sp. (ex Lucinoma aequizonata)]|nr:hypothetical protein [Candidatus Thiodiazotropha sp. (ex Lucinoma aequizonata)]MCU7913871.1 hypothetical protein [Candidatus Thiodiazotropha sp. (ex Lucinoma aequizonata)]